MNRTVLIILVVMAILIICCVLMVVLTSAGIIFLAAQDSGFTWDFDTNVGPATATPVVIRPAITPTAGTSGIDESPVSDDLPLESGTLQTLKDAVVPINDLIDLAERLGGIEDIPQTVNPPAEPYQIGDGSTFWLTNVDTNENSQVEMTLRYATDHAYFWVENGVRYDEDELEDLALTFENDIYPTNRTFFGSEWSPGVDGDPHLYILYARDLGYSLAGYYSSADEFHPLAHEYSNAHETFVLNADNVGFGEEYTYGVLAHEFQHMIHWYRDRNESSWLNEGFSELASFLNGYDAGGFDYLYTSKPDLQLNDWPNDPSKTSPHYGSSFMFVTYFLDRFGDTATQALVAHPDNGMTSVDAVLREMNAQDPLSGELIQADDLFADWVVTNFLHDTQVADGRYAYHNNDSVPSTNATETVSDCNGDSLTRDVHQYGVDYIRVNCSGDHTIHFEGSVQVGLVPQDPYSGTYAFWSNKGDESDMTLTRSFDFSDHSGPLTLTFWTWYDLEEDYDYIYLETSSDGGETWQIITTPSGTNEDPSGNSYGWAYNALSGGDGKWIQETIDLSEFAGENLLIRFEYVTDAAVNGEGLLLDDIAIPEIGYFSDFEEDDGGWEAAGFVRIQNYIPQTYQLALISRGAATTVQMIALDNNNAADIPIHIGGDVEDVILVVSGTTRFTRQEAAYRFEITP
ncbi:MAG: hypothetical protein ABFS03_11465 [Chloroflexota bacterium]